MKTVLFAVSAAFLFVAQSATADEFKIDDLVIGHPKAFETAATAKAGGGYLSVTNTGITSDRLVDVKGDFPRVELHKSEEKDGLVSMSPVGMIEIPAGETILLEPGGMHIMFMGLQGHPFKLGNKIPLTLVFEQAGEVDIVLNVEERDQAAKKEGHRDHSDHSGSN